MRAQDVDNRGGLPRARAYCARRGSARDQDGPTHLLPLLRQATRDVHHRVEQHALLAPLTSARLDRAAYVRVLGAFFGFFRTLEPRLCRLMLPLITGEEGGYRYLPRTGELRQDLLDLNASDILEDACPARALASPRLETLDHVLGTLYVLEGATQGGRIIAPRVCRALGLDAVQGVRYFHAYTHGQWAAFRALMSARELQHDPEGVVDGARDTFAAVGAHLDAWWNKMPRS
nr:biliverdin-producing heme oxygenase [Aquisalimonas sp.]